MKTKLFIALLTLSACSRDHGGIMTSPSNPPTDQTPCTQSAVNGQITTTCPNGITGTLVPNTPVTIPVTPDPVLPTLPAPVGAPVTTTVNDDPGQSPGQSTSDQGAQRTDLYSCGSIGKDLSTSNRFTAQIEVFADLSRKYFVTAYLSGGIVESFVADEAAYEAAPYSPILLQAGAIQSSNVLHGINEQTKTALGLSEGSNFKINLRSSAMKPNMEIFLNAYDVDTMTESSLNVLYGVCVRNSN